jgi:hypothetical protein
VAKKKDKTKKGAEPTLRELVSRYVTAQVSVIIDGLPRLRDRDQAELVTSDDAVRKLRSTLRSCEELIDIPRSARFDDDLTWLATRLDRLVDLDLVSSRMADAIHALPPELVVGRVASQLETELQLSRKEAWDGLVDDLDGDRAQQLLAQLHGWRADPPFTAEADRPAKKANALRKRADERADRRRDTARAAATHDPHATQPDTSTALERARVAALRRQHLRELVSGEAADGAAGPDALEEHRRSLLTSALLREIGIQVGVRSGHNGFSYGLLFADERQRQRDLSTAI